MKLLEQKKAQVQSLAPAIIGLVFAAFVLVMGLIILQSLNNSDIVDQAASTTISNETVTNFGTLSKNVATVGDRGANSFTMIRLTNATGGEVIAAGNYTFSTAGALVATASSAYNASSVNISYTYVHGDEAWVAANSTVSNIGNFSDFWEIIVLAIVISIVIGLLLVVFAGKARR